jgi:hypothetical protein
LGRNDGQSGVINRGDSGSRSTGTTRTSKSNYDDLLKRKSGSRSGTVKYDSNTNVRRTNGNPLNIDRMPIDIRRGSLGNMVRRSDSIYINNTRIRFGYNHYDSRWCDDYFYYPHYIFDPYGMDWVFSPWYYYPQLPGYFNSRRCYFPTSYTWAPFYGVRYTWNQPSREYWNRNYNELDYVIDDIRNAFMDGDRRAVDRLIPRRGNVAIINEGRMAYSLRPDDFYDTFLDGIENSRTIDYRILDVQYRRDAASIFARHDFEDPWGRRLSVFHYYKVEAEGRDWVIREFGTSSRSW